MNSANQDSLWSTWLVAVTSAVRAAFGVIWAIDAYLKWQPGFAAHYVGYLQNAAKGQPDCSCTPGLHFGSRS